MKKVLALILCLIMVAALAVSTVSADEDNPIDYRELIDYGQLHFYLGEAIAASEKPNVTDGKVSADEYVYTYEYSPASEPQIVTISGSETSGFYDTDWVKLYMSHDGEKLYMAYEVKDNAYYPEKENFMINIGGRDAGSQLDAASRLRYDFGGDPTKGILVNEEVTTGSSKFWKEYPNDAWVSPAPSFEFEEHVGERSLAWDKDNGVLTLEVEFNIQPMLDYWHNELEVEEVRLAFFPLYMMYGDSAKGAADGPIKQGELWFRFNEGLNPMIKMDFVLDYLDSSYWLGWTGHIIHFCEEPEPTTPAPTTTEAPTEPPVTTTKKPDAATTTKPADDGTTAAPTDAATTAAATTEAPKKEGCGGTIALTALALVPMLGAAVVFGKKKED